MRVKLLDILLVTVMLPVICIAQPIVTFDSIQPGTTFGTPQNNSPGDIIWTENLIDVSVHNFYSDATTTHFGYCEIVDPIPGFPGKNLMSVNNISLQFDFNNVLISSYYVIIDFATLGGISNLQVNGAPLIIDPDLELNAPQKPAPDVSWFITTGTIPGGRKSRVMLLGGTVKTLLIGGQNLYLDNVRLIEQKAGPGVSVTKKVDFESQPYNKYWGGTPYSNNPKEIIITENDIEISVHHFKEDTNKLVFNHCHIDYASKYGFGTGQVMALDSLTLLFDLTKLGEKRINVRLEFARLGGIENLEINGANYFVGELDTVKSNPAPDITWYISKDQAGGMLKATVLIYGNVTHLAIGGQNLLLDNIWFTFTPVPTGVGDQFDDYLQPTDFKLCQNFPNPFNPETAIPFSLKKDSKVTVKIFNVLGQEMITLLDRDLGAGKHVIQWNGTDKNGVYVSSGVYFYRVESNGNKAVRKMMLMR